MSDMHKLLGLSKQDYQKMLERKYLKSFEYQGMRYYCLSKDFRHLERGTSIINGEVIRGFPKIRRALYLAPALSRHFSGRVAVEEKMNGYNVRIARAGKDIFALTRGGFICPFSTMKVQEMRFEKFFKDNLELVLCGEIFGPENPYQPEQYPVESVGFCVFDIRRKGTGESLPVLERRKLAEKYELPQVKLFGIFSIEEAKSRIPEIIKGIGREGREGIVIKALDMKKQMKYTCSESTCADLSFAFKFLFEYGRDFIFRRIIREGFQAVEWREDEKALEERAHRLGSALLLPMVETIDSVNGGVEVRENFRIRVKSMEEVYALIEYLRRMRIRVVLTDVEEKGREKIASFYRVHRATNDKIKAYLEGEFCRE
ncbi:MAG: RNA ligase [Methanobacteriota archaeon]